MRGICLDQYDVLFVCVCVCVCSISSSVVFVMVAGLLVCWYCPVLNLWYVACLLVVNTCLYCSVCLQIVGLL